MYFAVGTNMLYLFIGVCLLHFTFTFSFTIKCYFRGFISLISLGFLRQCCQTSEQVRILILLSCAFK